MSVDTSPSSAGVFDVTLPARPYPGLRPFGKEEWPIFFGREQMIDDVVGRLVGQRLLVVHGDSGCGKSSLIRAGVLPRLEQDTARGGRRWITRVMTPGDEPLAHLADSLADTVTDAPAISDAELEARRLQLRRVLNCGRDGSQTLVDLVCGDRDPYICLLIDQFEELFAHARRRGPQQASLLIEQVLGLRALQSDRLFVVLTMRSEFLGACAQFEGFAAAVNATQYLLPRMQHTDLLRAIREPATLYDGEITIDLAERLIAESRGSQDELPLIQHGLMQMHQAAVRAPDGTWKLTLADYRNPHGLAGLLSDHADAVMAQVEPDDRGRDGTRVTEDLFRALTDINADGQATRDPRRLRDVIAITGVEEPAVRRVIDAFRAEGVSFMRPYGTGPIGPDDYIDISHEALIRCWARIADPVNGWLTREFKNGLVWRSLVVQADSFEADPSSVLSPATAEERSRWLKRRNEAWSQRYGGRWASVNRLVDASMASRERAMQRELEERTRDERARAEAEQAALREEQARLRETTLQSELAAAREKSKRLKSLRWGLVVSLILLGVAATAAVAAYLARVQSEKDRVAAVQAADDARRAAVAASIARRDERQQSERVLATLTQQIDGLKASLSVATPSTTNALQQRIDQVGYSIAKAAAAPRVYIHIADESQREAARALERRIESARVGDRSLIVPGIQRVANAPPRALLRCFVAEECTQYGPQILDAINRALIAPTLRLQDFSNTYTPDGSIRALHFEIYLPPGPITLRPDDAKKSAY